MKNIILIIIFLLLAFFSYCQEGIRFENLTFKEALAKAKVENKLIFMDCYTKTCVPCKLMEKEVFTQQEVGDFMNRNFICLKYDMQEGEGCMLRERFGVNVFPTFIFICPDGTFRHKFSGGGNADSFIKRVKEALDDEKALGVFEEKYKNGNRDKSFLLKYIRRLEDRAQYIGDSSARKVVDELFRLASDEDKVSKDYWFIFNNEKLSPRGSDVMGFLIANRQKFYETVRREDVEARLSKDILEEIKGCVYDLFGVKRTNAIRLNGVEKNIKELKLLNEKVLLALLAIPKAIITDDVDKILAACKNAKQLAKGEDLSVIYFIYNTLAPKLNEKQKADWLELYYSLSK